VGILPDHAPRQVKGATGGFGLIGGVLMILFVPETLRRTPKVIAESDAIGSSAR
jgi:hypothetical protein